MNNELAPFPLVLMGGRAEGLVCADLGAINELIMSQNNELIMSQNLINNELAPFLN